MIRLRIIRDQDPEEFEGLVWVVREGRRNIMWPVVIEQQKVIEDGPFDGLVYGWEPVEVVDALDPKTA